MKARELIGYLMGLILFVILIPLIMWMFSGEVHPNAARLICLGVMAAIGMGLSIWSIIYMKNVGEGNPMDAFNHEVAPYEMYKIRTTKAPSKGDKFGFFAQDEVEYEVHVENTGNIVLTMDVSDQFTQNPEYFTVPKLKDVKFNGEGKWNNKGKDEFVANITLEPGEKAVVTYTAVVSNVAKEYLAAKAKDSDSLDDKGHDTNRLYQKNKTDDL